MSNEKVFFIRHNLIVPNDKTRTIKLLNEIWERKMAVMDYERVEDPSAFNPDHEKYSRRHVRSAIRRFRDLAQAGGFIAMVCNSAKPNQMLLGKVSPSQPLKTTKFDSLPDYPFKAIKISESKVVSLIQYPDLFSMLPRQTAFTEWYRGRDHFFSALKGLPRPAEVKSLSAGQLEILCYEYLRQTGKIQHLLLP
ncbi:MAG: hypothetical protein ABL958_21430, partial [Bdellovibrionia bacterium]